MCKLLQLLFIIVIACSCTAQDSLRGSITAERKWWDVVRYDITIEPNFIGKSLAGQNIITFRALDEGIKMQVDLQQPMEIETATLNDEKNPLPLTRNNNVYYITFAKKITKGSENSITIKFKGTPREARTPPWDGGWIWKQDKRGNPWATVACQGLGASVWYPCKDHQGDEPAGASLSIIVPENLVGVGNGRLVNKTSLPGKRVQYTWEVKNSINNYNIVPYIGRYVKWCDEYNGEKGNLDITYWALEEDEEKARNQFPQTIKMLQCFEHWFGPYPFYEDGFQLVESPHLGMEHQSAIAYGNKFVNGYLGTDLSGTGWGKKWDFIIVHESGHEWFGNNITTNDIADMWVHEGFTNYSEVLFTQCEYGKEAGNEYCVGLRKNIKNDKPVIGDYGLNREGSEDMYYKGASVVHMVRQIMNDDEKFRQMLRGMNATFYHKTVNTADIEQFMSKAAGKDLGKIFDQYLRTSKIPVLEYHHDNGTLKFRWSNCVEGFDMPLKILAGDDVWLSPTTQWQTISLKSRSFVIDPNFYVASRKM
ncbi:MAG: M1 family metallopeptidase [Chitinophagaceae bacterium]|nr:M1 family metallopeptidase [Chitinophagaceae bacterium]